MDSTPSRATQHSRGTENVETASIVVIAPNSASIFSLFPILALPQWIVYVLIGFAGAAGDAVVLVLILERRRQKLTQG